MLSKKLIIILFIQFGLSYNIFNHTQDYKVSTSSYAASYSIDNSMYNFLILLVILIIISLCIQF